MEILIPLGWVVVVVAVIAIVLVRDGPTSVRCPDCDADLPKGTAVCTFCGYDFQGIAG